MIILAIKLSVFNGIDSKDQCYIVFLTSEIVDILVVLAMIPSVYFGVQYA